MKYLYHESRGTPIAYTGCFYIKARLLRGFPQSIVKAWITAQIESVVEPGEVGNDIGWESVTLVGIHRPMLPNSSGQIVSTLLFALYFVLLMGGLPLLCFSIGGPGIHTVSSFGRGLRQSMRRARCA